VGNVYIYMRVIARVGGRGLVGTRAAALNVFRRLRRRRRRPRAQFLRLCVCGLRRTKGKKIANSDSTVRERDTKKKKNPLRANSRE